MTTLQYAFLLLCFAQMLHFSQHWYRLTSSLWGDYQENRRRNAVNWKSTTSRR
ncbi:MAG: hypothetical protein AAFQ64_15310 [Pseudomonadota bacterium]